MEQLPNETLVDWQRRMNEESKSSDEESEIMFRVNPVVASDSQSQVEADDGWTPNYSNIKYDFMAE